MTVRRRQRPPSPELRSTDDAEATRPVQLVADDEVDTPPLTPFDLIEIEVRFGPDIARMIHDGDLEASLCQDTEAVSIRYPEMVGDGLDADTLAATQASLARLVEVSGRNGGLDRRPIA